MEALSPGGGACCLEDVVSKSDPNDCGAEGWTFMLLETAMMEEQRQECAGSERGYILVCVEEVQQPQPENAIRIDLRHECQEDILFWAAIVAPAQITSGGGEGISISADGATKEAGPTTFAAAECRRLFDETLLCVAKHTTARVDLALGFSSASPQYRGVSDGKIAFPGKLLESEAKIEL